MKKLIHKYDRTIKSDMQWRHCDGVICTFAENVAWRWDAVTCKRCKSLKGIPIKPKYDATKKQKK